MVGRAGAIGRQVGGAQLKRLRPVPIRAFHHHWHQCVHCWGLLRGGPCTAWQEGSSNCSRLFIRLMALLRAAACMGKSRMGPCCSAGQEREEL